MKQIDQFIQTKKSFLCIGLDTDINKIPKAFKRYKNPVLEFNKAVIEATHDLCISYKINTAFYESQGVEGWENLEKTVQAIPSNIFTIADAKRGDIGNTALQYAKAFFDRLPFDALTVNPMMGMDTVEPFLSYEDKTIILLALTSNPGSKDFEMQELASGKKFYEHMIEQIVSNCPAERTQLVVGATHPQELKNIRKLAPDNFFLVPGVGAQGGNATDVYNYGKNDKTGLLVNVSRGIIYAGNEAKDPSEAIREAALKYQSEMNQLLIK